MKGRLCAPALALLILAAPAAGAPPGAPNPWAAWLALGEAVFQNEAATQPAPPAERKAAPPLPFHTIEGAGGACIVPMAYLVNPPPKGRVFGVPALSFTYINAGHKNVETVAITETLWDRIELGYSASRFDMGTLPKDIEKATGMSTGRDDVYLHSLSARAMLIKENSFDLPTPALTFGANFKYNDTIRKLDDRLNGALSGIGFERSSGVDFTLTASKMVSLGRPFIFSAGLRNSQASQIGFLGFGDQRATTFEGSVVCLATDWLAIGYEFRQKSNPYDKIPGLVGDEDNWHVISVGLILGEHATLCAGWGHLGNLVNSSGDGAWALQLKFEF